MMWSIDGIFGGKKLCCNF